MILVDHRIIQHAAHYLWGHPDRGHDLEEWVIEREPAIGLPVFTDVIALGVAPDARWHHSDHRPGSQRLVYAARRPMSHGKCARCLLLEQTATARGGV